MTDRHDAPYYEALDRTWTNNFIRKRGWEGCYLVNPVERIEQFARSVHGSEVLDVGCGWARYVSLFVGHRLRYRGIDLSEEAIAYARASHPALAFDIGNFRVMPYADRSFDGVWSCCTLGTLPKRYTVEILKERRRVLRPGGILMEIAQFPPYGFSEEYMHFEDETPQIYRAYFSLDELRNHLSTAGFEIIDYDEDLQTGTQHVLARA